MFSTHNAQYNTYDYFACNRFVLSIMSNHEILYKDQSEWIKNIKAFVDKWGEHNLNINIKSSGYIKVFRSDLITSYTCFKYNGPLLNNLHALCRILFHHP